VEDDVDIWCYAILRVACQKQRQWRQRLPVRPDTTKVSLGKYLRLLEQDFSQADAFGDADKHYLWNESYIKFLQAARIRGFTTMRYINLLLLTYTQYQRPVC